MYQERHYKTRTYGASPQPSIAKIHKALDALPVNATVERTQGTVEGVVRGEMNEDHKTVRSIYAAAKIPKPAKDRVDVGIQDVKKQNRQWWP
jgi:hypothetical protein